MVQAPSVAGYRGLKASVLIALKRAQPLTARELGERFALTPNALRRHLRELEADGMVAYRREVRGVGGPTFAYVLTTEGERLFPNAYAPALLEAIEAVREARGSAGVAQVFARHWAETSEGAAQVVRSLPLGERVQLLAELMSARGYMAEAAPPTEGWVAIRAHNCALHDIAARYPEACEAEREFLERTLGVAVERTARVHDGCNCCEYVIREPGATVSSRALPLAGSRACAAAADKETA